MRVLANGAEAEASARAALGDVRGDRARALRRYLAARHRAHLRARRATAPIALRFKTNGWGGKFDLPDDETVGDDIARFAGVPTRRFDFVLEGGAVEHDGEGTILTTRADAAQRQSQRLERGEGGSRASRRVRRTRRSSGSTKASTNDHTDGHIDNIARFVGPGRVVCQSPAGPDDPNAETLEEIARVLESATDARGRKLDVIRIPSPGLRPERIAARPRPPRM